MANSSTVQELIEEGKRSQASGDLAHALANFTLATQLNPEDETVWLLRSEVTSDPAEAAYCLEQVLKLNPDNTVAKEKILAKRVGTLQQQVRQHTEAPKPKARFGKVKWQVLVLVLVLLVCGVGAVGIVGAGLLANSSQLNGTTIAQIETPTLAVLELPATWTPVPTRTTTPMPRVSPTTAPAWKALYNLTVRSGPGTNYTALGTIPQGTVLIVSGKSEDGKYLLIDYGGGKLGWVVADSVTIGSADLAKLPIIAAPAIAAAPKTAPTVRIAVVPTVKPTPVPVIRFDFALGRPIEPVADCTRPWKVMGTVYDSRAGQRINGVPVRIWVSGQAVGTVNTGSIVYNMPGYWEWRFGSNSDVSGQIAIVNSDGTRRSDYVNFHLTMFCDGAGAANQVVIDMVGN